MTIQEQIIEEYLRILETAVAENDFEPIQMFFLRACELVEETGRVDYWVRLDAIQITFDVFGVWERNYVA